MRAKETRSGSATALLLTAIGTFSPLAGFAAQKLHVCQQTGVKAPLFLSPSSLPTLAAVFKQERLNPQGLPFPRWQAEHKQAFATAEKALTT
jgi:hypothetical protein